jgi:hypothetical protein
MGSGGCKYALLKNAEAENYTTQHMVQIAHNLGLIVA